MQLMSQGPEYGQNCYEEKFVLEQGKESADEMAESSVSKQEYKLDQSLQIFSKVANPQIMTDIIIKL